jgi:hypothetical protein
VTVPDFKVDDPFDVEWVPSWAMINEAGVPDLNRNFLCVMVAKGRIDDDLRRVLIEEALDLVCRKRRSNRFETDWCEGCVTTKFEYAHLGGLSGIRFECEAGVDIKSKTVKATFIITSSLLDRFTDAAWLRNRSDEGPPLKTSYFN